jgi:hypothetical protein
MFQALEKGECATSMEDIHIVGCPKLTEVSLTNERISLSALKVYHSIASVICLLSIPMP